MVNGVIVMFALSISAQAPAADGNQSKDSKELSRLEDAWNEAHLKGDSAALDKLWGEELVVTVPKMPSFSKAQSLAVWKTGRFKFERYQTSDVRIKVLGDVAIATGRVQRTRRMGDRKMEDDWLFTKTYVRTKGGWQVVAYHASDGPEGRK